MSTVPMYDCLLSWLFLFFRAFIVIVSAHEQDSTITAMKGNTARTQHMAATTAAVKQVIREKKKIRHEHDDDDGINGTSMRERKRNTKQHLLDENCCSLSSLDRRIFHALERKTKATMTPRFHCCELCFAIGIGESFAIGADVRKREIHKTTTHVGIFNVI